MFVGCPIKPELPAAADLPLCASTTPSFRPRCRLALGGGVDAALPVVSLTITEAAAGTTSGELRREGDDEAPMTSVEASLVASSSAFV